MKPITIPDALKAFQSGEKVHIVELRHSKAETINYRDKKTGQPASFTQIRHSIELGDTPALVGERVPDGFKPDEFKQSMSKGTKCLLRYDSCMIDKGVNHYSGTLQPLAS
jgi:hypothetical protein